MERYYFHIRRKSVVFEDRRGGEFADLLSAWNWAVEDARALVAESALEAPPEEHWVEIHDTAGSIVATMPFARALPLH